MGCDWYGFKTLYGRGFFLARTALMRKDKKTIVISDKILQVPVTSWLGSKYNYTMGIFFFDKDSCIEAPTIKVPSPYTIFHEKLYAIKLNEDLFQPLSPEKLQCLRETYEHLTQTSAPETLCHSYTVTSTWDTADNCKWPQSSGKV